MAAEANSVQLDNQTKLDGWESAMSRVLRPGGWIAFEVGELQGGKVRLEE